MGERFNLLCDRLPTTLEADGVVLPILTDFRRWILVTEIFSAAWDPVTAVRCALEAVAPGTPWQTVREHLPALVKAMGHFASGGKSGSVGGGEPVLDFSVDGEMIVASFWQAYGVDLTRCRMHWWKFLALLRHLPPESELMRVIRLRACDLSTIGDDGVRRQVRRAKAALRIRREGDRSPERNGG